MTLEERFDKEFLKGCGHKTAEVGVYYTDTGSGWEFVDLEEEIKQFIKKELSDLKGELVGEEETPANKNMFMWVQGYNIKREEIINIFKKRGI